MAELAIIPFIPLIAAIPHLCNTFYGALVLRETKRARRAREEQEKKDKREREDEESGAARKARMKREEMERSEREREEMIGDRVMRTMMARVKLIEEMEKKEREVKERMADRVKQEEKESIERERQNRGYIIVLLIGFVFAVMWMTMSLITGLSLAKVWLIMIVSLIIGFVIDNAWKIKPQITALLMMIRPNAKRNGHNTFVQDAASPPLGSNTPAGVGGTDEPNEEGNAAYLIDKKFNQLPTAQLFFRKLAAKPNLMLNKPIQAEDEALKIDRDNYNGYARRAIAKSKLGNLKGALTDVEFSLEREPNSQEMKKLQADIKCLLSKASSAGRAKEEGNSYFKENKFDEAIKRYSEGIKVLPTAETYANRAMANLKVNKFAVAEEDCTQALKFDLEQDLMFKVYARRAIARRKQGYTGQLGALKDVEQALKLKPAEPEMSKLRDQLLLWID